MIPENFEEMTTIAGYYRRTPPGNLPVFPQQRIPETEWGIETVFNRKKEGQIFNVDNVYKF
jgi:hypothetical protein